MEQGNFGRAHERDVTGAVQLSLNVLRDARANAGSDSAVRRVLSLPQAAIGVLGYFAGGIQNEVLILSNTAESVALKCVNGLATMFRPRR